MFTCTIKVRLVWVEHILTQKIQAKKKAFYKSFNVNQNVQHILINNHMYISQIIHNTADWNRQAGFSQHVCRCNSTGHAEKSGDLEKCSTFLFVLVIYGSWDFRFSETRARI